MAKERKKQFKIILDFENDICVNGRVHYEIISSVDKTQGSKGVLVVDDPEAKIGDDVTIGQIKTYIINKIKAKEGI